MKYESEIHVLELMVKHYEERGGGYSQKEALKIAIKSLRTPKEKVELDEGEVICAIEKYDYKKCDCELADGEWVSCYKCKIVEQQAKAILKLQGGE